MKTLSLVAALVISQPTYANLTSSVARGVRQVTKAASTSAPLDEAARLAALAAAKKATAGTNGEAAQLMAKNRQASFVAGEVLKIVNGESRVYGKSSKQVVDLLKSTNVDNVNALDGYKFVGTNSKGQNIFIKATPNRIGEYPVADGYTMSYPIQGQIRIAVHSVFESAGTKMKGTVAQKVSQYNAILAERSAAVRQQMNTVLEQTQLQYLHDTSEVLTAYPSGIPNAKESYILEKAFSSTDVYTYQLSDLLYQLLK